MLLTEVHNHQVKFNLEAHKTWSLEAGSSRNLAGIRAQPDKWLMQLGVVVDGAHADLHIPPLLAHAVEQVDLTFSQYLRIARTKNLLPSRITTRLPASTAFCLVDGAHELNIGHALWEIRNGVSLEETLSADAVTGRVASS